MPKTTYSEEIALRALTGRVVGHEMLREYSRVAFVSVKNTICLAISAAAEASFVDRTSGRFAHFVVEKGAASEVAEGVAAFEPEAVVLMFGGETPIEETKELFVETLRALAKQDLPIDIVVHVRIFAAKGLEQALQDATIRDYLGTQIVLVYTADLDRGVLVLNEAEIDEEGGYELDVLEEYPVTVEHADLLNRSLRDKKVAWVDA